MGQKLVNAWGLYDMYGNVWQWCDDRWEVGHYYAASPTDDPPGPPAQVSGWLAAFTAGVAGLTAAFAAGAAGSTMPETAARRSATTTTTARPRSRQRLGPPCLHGPGGRTW